MDTPSQAPLFHPNDTRSLARTILTSNWLLIGIALLIAVIIGFTFIPRLLHPVAPLNAPMPSSQAMEQAWGIQITQVAVTADEGMVDLRYKVIDPVKAANFGVDQNSTPMLYSDSSQSTVFVTAEMPHKEVVNAGAIYFLLYHNTNGAIKKQSYISLTLGSVKLDGIPVR